MADGPKLPVPICDGGPTAPPPLQGSFGTKRDSGSRGAGGVPSVLLFSCSAALWPKAAPPSPLKVRHGGAEWDKIEGQGAKKRRKGDNL